jgi:hypothetical protein
MSAEDDGGGLQSRPHAYGRDCDPATLMSVIEQMDELAPRSRIW